MKRILTKSTLAVLFASALSASPFFSGYTGFLAEVQNKQTSKTWSPELGSEAFFSGQLEFDGNFFIRGEFYVNARDIFREDVFSVSEDNSNAKFRIEEISATYVFPLSSATHYLSAYRGNFEPAGSDIFLQRQFGISPINSKLTESFHGIEGNSVYPSYVWGAAYTIHTLEDNVIKVSLFKDTVAQDNSSHNFDTANLDVRFASLFSQAVIDIMGGFSVPLEDRTLDGEEIDKTMTALNGHGAASVLLGNTNRISFFSQVGLEKVVFIKGHTSENRNISWNDIYLLAEPRVNTQYFTTALSIFNFPTESAQNMLYLSSVTKYAPETESVYGFDLDVFSDHLYIKTTKLTAGAHLIGAYVNATPGNIEHANMKVILAPYTKIMVSGGELIASATVNFSELHKHAEKFYGVNFGFKTRF